MEDRQILRAWGEFLENGTSPSAVREIVADSWKRSQEHHIPVERSETLLAPEAELIQRRTENSELIQAAQPALEQARMLLADAGSMVILTDPSGFIIDTAGDARTIDTARLIHLEQGGRWAEADIGTNAIGTVIAALQPVQIHGGEHFCSEVQRWTCAATPVWHPTTREFLGILDISGSAKNFNPQSLAFACAVGRQIENAIAHSLKDEHERLLRYSLSKRSDWLSEDILVIDRCGMIVHATGAALRVVEQRNQGLIRNGRISSLGKGPVMGWPASLTQLVPGSTAEFVVDYNRVIGAILVVHGTPRKSLAAVTAENTGTISEWEMSGRQRIIELANANRALQECLDSLASVPELDELLGQVISAISQQLGAVSSVLQLRDFEQNCLTIELVFQDGRVIAAGEGSYPQSLLSVPLDEEQLSLFNQSAVVFQLIDPNSALPDEPRSSLLELGVKTLLVVPLNVAGQLIGALSFRFAEHREFRPEEIEIARALESQAALAVQVTRLAKAAKQAAIRAERTRLAGEIHDGLAQSFNAICMQLGVATEELYSKEGDPIARIQRALELANFGLSEARRFSHTLHLSTVEQLGLAAAFQGLAERSSVAGRLRCNFRAGDIPEDNLPPKVKHELIRIAQEAIHNAVRHANPTLIGVTLEWDAPNLVLKVRDNGSGISTVRLESSDGLGLGSMRARALEVGGSFEIQTAVGRGTTIVVSVPVHQAVRQFT
jgi:signal transduction histidine kinase